MRSINVILVAALAVLFHCTAAQRYYNEAKAKQFAESIVMEASKKVIERNNAFSQLRDIRVLVPFSGVLTPGFNAAVSGSLNGLPYIVLDQCEYIPAFSAIHNVTIRCGLLLRNVEALLNVSFIGVNPFGKVRQAALHTEIEGVGPISVSWQGRNGLYASLSELTTPPLKLVSSSAGGSLEGHKDWVSFVKAVHSSVGKSIHFLLKNNYRQVLEEATELRFLPTFYRF